MARLTEEMVIARSKQSDLAAVRKLNCWGAELGDVSLLRRMPNVEVLALSINKIRTLSDFAECRRLRELYVRKNDIRELRELRHLRRLPALTSLWLDENPCALHPEYRATVLRALPRLERLDNVPVQPGEAADAARRGLRIPDTDDEDDEVEGGGESELEDEGGAPRERGDCCDDEEEEEEAPRLAASAPASDESEGEPPSPPAPPRRAAPPAMSRSCYEARSPEAAGALRHSLSAHSVKEYAYSSNGECRAAAGECRAAAGECRAAAGERDVPCAVMAERRGFTRRPVARNSNLLSAVLCLVKELDYASLEVAEMAVRCRMDELADSP